MFPSESCSRVRPNQIWEAKVKRQPYTQAQDEPRFQCALEVMLCAQLFFPNADSGDQECPQAHHKIVLPTHRGGDLKEPTSFRSFPSTPAALCSAASRAGPAHPPDPQKFVYRSGLVSELSLILNPTFLIFTYPALSTTI